MTDTTAMELGRFSLQKPKLSTTGRFRTPPKRRLSTFVTPRTPPQRRQLTFTPLSLPNPVPPSRSPKRKRPRTSQKKSPKKVNPFPSLRQPSKDELSKDSIISGPEDDPFGMRFACNSFAHIEFDDRNVDLFSAVSQLAVWKQRIIPQYLKSLQSNPQSFAQITERYIVLQDWDIDSQSLKVCNFYPSPAKGQEGKYKHVFSMTDVDGHVVRYCDCLKGTNASNKCLHILLVSDHSMDFDGPIYEGEEPFSFLISIENNTNYFSVATNSGSFRHHTSKRTIVTYSIKESWKCQSCSKERDCRHIHAAQEDARSLNVLTLDTPEDRAVAMASRNISIRKAVSHLPIPPPEWCRLPQDTIARTPPFNGGRNLPSYFSLDDTSRCSCGQNVVSEEVTTSELVIYCSFTVMFATVETSYCASCPNTRGNVGPDLGRYSLFNWNNNIAFSHELMNAYTSQFTTSETPIHAFFQTITHTYQNEQSIPFCSERTFLSAWFAFVELQVISSDMQCRQCGPDTEVVIADGISVSFSKHKVESLCPPTVSNKSKDLIKLPRKSTKATCFVASSQMRAQIQKALDEEDMKEGKEKLRIILQNKETVESDEDANILLDGVSFYCNLNSNDNLVRRFHQFLRQIFSSDSILQLIRVKAIPFLQQYSEGASRDPRLGALVPALEMIFRNLDPYSEIGKGMDLCLRKICAVLAQRSQFIYEDLIVSRNVMSKSARIDLINDWKESGCYYGKQPYRPRPFYEGRDIDHESVNMTEEGTCRKLFSTYGKKTLTGGLMALWCPHLICVGFHKMPKAEGRNDVFSAILQYWPQAPKVVIYDFACQLGPYCMTREPEFFKDTLFVIDEMHAKGHNSCSQACFVSNYMQVSPTLMNVNSSAAECSNAGLNRIRKSVSYMDQQHAIIFTYVYLCIWNRRMERKFIAEQDNQLSRFRI